MKLIEQAPQQSPTKLKLSDQSTITPLGQTKLLCKANGITKKVHFQVIKDAPTSLLSGKVCEALELLQFNEECVLYITLAKQNALTLEQVLRDYSDVFTGLGTLARVYHIDTDPKIKPVQNNPRRVPIPVKEELKNKIDELEAMGVLANVTEPTPWTS